MQFKRVVCLVADGLGIGAAPDAHAYGDEGSDTFGHVVAHVGGMRLPNLEKLGIGNLGSYPGISRVAQPIGYCGKMAEKSVGKDTTTGHWEIAGIVTTEALPTFPHGFPASLVKDFVDSAELPGVLGNCAASGTAIIDEWGAEHLKTGKPILYTSADSVFQIAAHEEAFGLERLYAISRLARKLTEPFKIGRVIARPFVGEPGSFRRTENRRDYSLAPAPNCLDALQKSGVSVLSVGKIEDIFDHRGISAANHTGNNRDGLAATLDFLKSNRNQKSFVFTNLVDFDMLYGHRRDPVGFARALTELDNFLPNILGEMTEGDLFVMTADHGCDPTFRGSDHTREYVPLVTYAPGTKGGALGIRTSFCDVAATLLEGYGVESPGGGQSFLCELKK